MRGQQEARSAVSHDDILAAIEESKQHTRALTERIDALWERSQARDDLLARMTDILEYWDTGKRAGQFFVGIGKIIKWVAGIVAAIAVIGAAWKFALESLFHSQGGNP